MPRRPGALARVRRYSAAEALLEKARALRPGDAGVLTLSAELGLHVGEIEQATAFARQAIASDADHSPAYVVLVRGDAGKIDDATLESMVRLASRSQLGSRRLRGLLNAIGRVFETRGDFDRAFEHFAGSNRHAGASYNPAKREARLQQARLLFDRDYFQARQSFGLRGTGCAFIVGMPRSGSTLLEQVLAAHPEADTCGESDALSDLDVSLRRALSSVQRREGYFPHLRTIGQAQAADAAQTYLAATSRQLRRQNPRRRIDKRLGNFLHLPLARLMFPDAVVLHTHRHPLDVCLSCFTQDFDGHSYANDLADLAHFYLVYQGYMRLWSELFGDALLHCRYETLIAAFEPEARRILGVLGLDWNEACAEPRRAGRLVATASAVQVREPMHTRRVERWRNYEEHLESLIAGLGGLQGIDRLHREFAKV